jgi:hypothetical protein
MTITAEEIMPTRTVGVDGIEASVVSIVDPGLAQVESLERSAICPASAAGQSRLHLEHGLGLHARRNDDGSVIVGARIYNGFGSLWGGRQVLVAASDVLLTVPIIFSSFLLSLRGLRRR